MMKFIMKYSPAILMGFLMPTLLDVEFNFHSVMYIAIVIGAIGVHDIVIREEVDNAK